MKKILKVILMERPNPLKNPSLMTKWRNKTKTLPYLTIAKSLSTTKLNLSGLKRRLLPRVIKAAPYPPAVEYLPMPLMIK